MGISRYIQRGKFREEVKENTGLDSILTCDYMGSAEYEFGALPRSLKRIVSLYKGITRGFFKKKTERFYNFHYYLLMGKAFYIGTPAVYIEADRKEIATFFESEAKKEWKYNLKESSHISCYFQGQYIEQLKKGCKNKKEQVYNHNFCDFWWDIERDWIIFPFDKLNLVTEAFDKLIERKYV